MNNNLVKYQPGILTKSGREQAPSSLQLIIFGIGKLHLAFRIESVYKVLDYTPIHGSGLSQFGVIDVEQQPVTVIDLYQRFFKTNQTSEDYQDGCLVIVQNPWDELYGIPVADTPVLMEVPLSEIRILPESYRRADTLGVASHVTVIPQETESLTVFLLDIELLLPG